MYLIPDFFLRFSSGVFRWSSKSFSTCTALGTGLGKLKCYCFYPPDSVWDNQELRWCNLRYIGELALVLRWWQALMRVSFTLGIFSCWSTKARHALLVSYSLLATPLIPSITNAHLRWWTSISSWNIARASGFRLQLPASVLLVLRLTVLQHVQLFHMRLCICHSTHFVDLQGVVHTMHRNFFPSSVSMMQLILSSSSSLFTLFQRRLIHTTASSMPIRWVLLVPQLVSRQAHVC